MMFGVAVLGGCAGAVATAAEQSVAKPVTRAFIIPQAQAALATPGLSYCGDVAGGESNFVMAAGTSCSTGRSVYQHARCYPGGNVCRSHGFVCLSESIGHQLSELICKRRGALILSQTY
ncbi:MAG: hypothetical protein M3Y22_18605 [Pseudomonadota bacterium]|nr:hypothetical protein [Pseudomonadota bacterium]